LQPSPAPTSSRETLVGSVERVTFHNEDSGFAVLKVKARGKRDLVIAVGHAASISAGEFIHAVGVWITDRTHGLQFKADLLKTSLQRGPSICPCSDQAWGRAWVRRETVRPEGAKPSAIAWMILGERKASGARRRTWRSARFSPAAPWV
jgi:hypothetical protein